MRSPSRTFSRGIISSRRMMPSAFCRSTMTLPYSTRLTVPLAISPTRSLNSPCWRSRSASRTFWTMTCLAFCAATRPKSSGGSDSAIRSPTLASGLRRIASATRDLGRLVLDGVDHLQHAGELGLAGLRVDLAADVVLAAVAGFRRLLDRVLHRRDDDLAVDRLLARHGVGDLQELQPVCADSCLRHASLASTPQMQISPRRLRPPPGPGSPFLARRNVSRMSSSVSTRRASPTSAERQADDLPAQLIEIDLDAHLLALDALEHAAEPLAPRDQLLQSRSWPRSPPTPRSRTAAPAVCRCRARKPRACTVPAWDRAHRGRAKDDARSPRTPPP